MTDLLPGLENSPARPVGRRERRAAERAHRAASAAAENSFDLQPSQPFAGHVEGSKLKPFRANAKAKAVWLTTLAQQVSAGLTPQEALATLGDDANTKRRRWGTSEASAFADEMMSRGYPFWTALQMTKILDDAAIIAIKSGGQAGNPAEALRFAATRMERAYKLRSKVRSALTMPVLTIALALAIGAYLELSVVPTLAEVFKSLGGQLPLLTRIVLGISHYAIYILLGLLLVTVAAVLGYRLARRDESRRIKIDTLKLRIPLVGKLLLDASLASTFQTLGLLMSSGITNFDALFSASGSSNNAAIQDIFRRAGEAAREVGRPVHDSLRAEPLIPRADIALLKASDKAGRSYDGPVKAADYHFVQADEAASRLSDSIGPVLTVVVGLIVGLLLMSIYLPMFRIYTLLGSQA